MQESSIIVFDFDGVVVANSEFEKEKAWETMGRELAIQDAHALRAARETFANGNGSRYDILRASFSNGQRSEEEISRLVEQYAARYNEIVQGAILRLGIRPEDQEGLERLVRAGYFLYVNSATPEDALNATVEKLGVTHFFIGLLGQPRSKVENLKIIAANHDISPTDLCFIGDGDGDWQAAQKVGCWFFGIANLWNRWTPGEKPFPLVASLRELAEKHFHC